MFQPRTLGRPELRFTHASGATNLVERPGEWHYLGPRHRDEIVSLSAVEVRAVGTGLLAHVGSLGGARLELGFEMADGFGGHRDLAATTFHTIQTAREWRDGTAIGTLVDTAARTYDDDSQRPGLRGRPVPVVPNPDYAKWESREITLRYGQEIEGVVWEADLLRDPKGNVLDCMTLALQVGREDAAGNVTWQRYPVAMNGAELAAGRRDFTPPLPAGDHLRWQVTMRFVATGEAAYANEQVVQTARLLLLGAWVRLDAHDWQFASVADLLLRAEPDPLLLPKSWKGTGDLVAARIALDTELRGVERERVRARVVVDGAAPLDIQHLEIAALGDVGFDPEA